MRHVVASRSERGSVTVLMAAVLFLAGVLTLAAVDLLRAVQARARAQTAADAAALAAAQEIAIPSGRSPQGVAAEYAERNRATLLSCTCEPFSDQAVVEVETTVDLVFVGRDRRVRGQARAVIEGAKLDGASTMAANAGSQKTPTGGSQAVLERSLACASADPPGGGGLHAGQAGATSRVATGPPLSPRDLRRSSRAAPRCPLSGGRRRPAMSGVQSARAPPPRLRLRRRPAGQQWPGVRGPGRPGAGRRAASWRLLRGRGVHVLQLEPSRRGVHGP
jgi:secretion/DNA translocation related TadE-like protein